MTDFAFTPLVNDPYKDAISTALGDGATAYTDTDQGKLVKLATAEDSAYELCSSGDEIEGMIIAIEPSTVNSGKSFGTVQRNKRIIAAGAGLAVGAFVVAGAQEALGTEVATYPVVIAGVPVDFKWRVIRVIDAATVLIELV